MRRTRRRRDEASSCWNYKAQVLSLAPSSAGPNDNSKVPDMLDCTMKIHVGVPNEAYRRRERQTHSCSAVSTAPHVHASLQAQKLSEPSPADVLVVAASPLHRLFVLIQPG